MPTIAEIADVFPGLPAFAKSNEGKQGEAVARAIGITALQDDAHVDFSMTDTVRFPVGWNVDSAQIREGDVLLTSRGTAMRAAIARHVPSAIFASSNLHVVRPKNDRVLPEILWACLTAFLNSSQQSHVLRQSVGQVSLPVREIRALRFDIPPLSQQQATADLIQSFLLARSSARATADQYGVVLRSFTSSHFSPNP